MDILLWARKCLFKDDLNGFYASLTTQLDANAKAVVYSDSLFLRFLRSCVILQQSFSGLFFYGLFKIIGKYY